MIPIQGEHREYGLLQLHGRPGLESVHVILVTKPLKQKYSLTAYRQDVRNMHFNTKIILQYNSQQLGIIIM